MAISIIINNCSMIELSSKIRSPNPSIQIGPFDTMHDINENTSIRQSPFKTRRSHKDVSRADIRRRLEIRKALHIRLALIADIMCFLGILGIVLMITENELTFNRIHNKDTRPSWFIKLIISLTTLILLILLIYYHTLDLKYYTNQNSLDNSRLGLTNTKIFLIITELLICAVHPIPRSFPYIESEIIQSNSTEFYSPSYTTIDVGLGLPMFLRLYLLSRSIIFHSKLVRDASLRSLGYLNQISIDFFFLSKTYIEQWPAHCSVVFCVFSFFIGSWSLRACDFTTTGEHPSISDSMWLFIATFTTVGYGDLSPETYCGRAVATIISVIGIITAALLVAVLAQKLLLTREEKYLHTFVLNTELTKQQQYHAANVVKFSIKVWYIKKRDKFRAIQCFQVQRKLFRSITYLQEIRKEQRRLIDKCIGLSELMNIQRDTNGQINETKHNMSKMNNNMKKIEDKLNIMTQNIDTLQTLLSMLVNQMNKQ